MQLSKNAAFSEKKKQKHIIHLQESEANPVGDEYAAART